MKTHGVQGASLSLDSVDAARHDAFRHLPGAWRGAIRATEALRAEGIDFSLHMSVTDWNVGEIPAMIDLARELGARVLNFFFLVRTGRGEGLTDITPAQYEEILTYLARAQGAGSAPAAPAPELRARAARGSLERAGGARGRPPDPGEVRAALPAGALRAGSRVAAAGQLRARLLPGRQVLLPHHAHRGRHAVPVHAGGGGQPPRDRASPSSGSRRRSSPISARAGSAGAAARASSASSAAAAAAARTRPTATTWPRTRPAATSRAPTAAS